MLDTLETAFGRLMHGLAMLVAGSIALMAILIPLNLLLVKMRWGSISWLYESVEYALYAGVFLGAPWVLQQAAHVRVDVLVSTLPERAAMRLEQLVDIAGAVLCAGLGLYGARAALMEYANGTMPDRDLQIANWIILALFAVSFLMLTIVFLFRVRRARERARLGRDSAGF
ncbi:MAG: TRAP transporter small permease [Burkholderiaceae bacterium]